MRLFYQYSIGMLWLAWLVYWCVAAVGTRQTLRREPVAARLLLLVPLGLGAGLLLSPHFAGAWLNRPFLPDTRIWFFIGFALVVAGICLAVLARVWLGANWSGNVTLKQDHELIRGGPYRWVRHPIYTGLLLALLGSALASGEWRGLVGLALIAISLLRKIAVEEQFMTEQFGEAYKRYQAEVPALVPLLY